jgi:hypothetical protein
VNKLLIQLLLVFALLSPGSGFGAGEVSAPAESSIDLELRVLKSALLNGPDKQNRDDAAMVLLGRNEPEARQILIEVLGVADNFAARSSICHLLIENSDTLVGKDIFLEPLIAILVEGDAISAKLAAEALDIFEYRAISTQFAELLRNPESSKQVRLNVISALKLWPAEKGAIFELVELLDDPDNEVVVAASEALPLWVPVNLSKQRILGYVGRMSHNAIIRQSMDYQEKELRRLEADLQRFQTLFLASLDREYEQLDEIQRGSLLVARLGEELSVQKLWALDKIDQRSAAVVLPDPDAGIALMKLISDADRQVRLKTANVLLGMSNLNPAEKLLGQLKVEKYADVKLAIFQAMGEACLFAFSPGSVIELPAAIKHETLVLAGEYLASADSAQAGAGAKVLRKMLELNGLEHGETEKYLKLLADRYVEAAGSEDGLDGVILNAMAKLCVQGSYKGKAAVLYRDYFVQALAVGKSEVTRKAAVDGLVNIDMASAFELFKAKGLYNDKLTAIRKATITLAKDFGKADDIDWLMKKLGQNGEGELSWEAVLSILESQKAAVAVQLADKVEAAGQGNLLNDLLAVALKLAQEEDAANLVAEITERQRIILLKTHLKAQNADQVAKLVTDLLAESDISANSEISVLISQFFASKVKAEAKNALFSELSAVKIDPSAPRPLWAGQLKGWAEKYGFKITPMDKEEAKPEAGDTPIDEAAGKAEIK